KTLTVFFIIFFFFQAEDGIRYGHVTGVQTCALPIVFPLQPFSRCVAFTPFFLIEPSSFSSKRTVVMALKRVDFPAPDDFPRSRFSPVRRTSPGWLKSTVCFGPKDR